MGSREIKNHSRLQVQQQQRRGALPQVVLQEVRAAHQGAQAGAPLRPRDVLVRARLLRLPTQPPQHLPQRPLGVQISGFRVWRILTVAAASFACRPSRRSTSRSGS